MIAIGGENLIDLVGDVGEGGNGASGALVSYVAHPGGSPFNVAMAAGRQGVATAYLTPISDDRFGDLLAARLVDSGVSICAPRDPHPTSLAVVSITGGIPAYGFYRDGTAERQVSTTMLGDAMPADICVFHVGSGALTGGKDADVWEAFFSHCKTAGLLVSLDPNVRPSLIADAPSYRARMRRMIGLADVLKLSDEDVCWLYEGLDFDQAKAACLQDSGAALTIFTRGSSGVDAHCGEQILHVKAHPVAQLADTVGAGDTFMASVLVWLVQNGFVSAEHLASLDGAGLTACLKRAAKAAALNCEHHGCVPPTADMLV